MEKEVVVHICNGKLLIYVKECIWVSYNEVDEPRAYYAKWSKSEGEWQIQYVNVYTWNLERWYQWFDIQGSKADADVKNRLSLSVEEGEGLKIWENCIETYTWPYVKQITSVSSMHEAGHTKLVLCDSLERWGEEGGGRGFRVKGIWIPMADSHWCMAKNHHNIVK